MKGPAQALAVVGVVLILIALAVNGASSDAASWIGAIGFFALLGAGAAFASYSGRVGPQQAKGSCCGCSCLVLVMVVPISGLALWSKGGPEMAALAIPAGVPIALAIDFADRMATSVVRKLLG